MTSTVSTYNGFKLEKLTIADGTIEAIKWLAIVLMTIDHINKYLLGASSDLFFALGRIAMPLFVLVMAYNLARQGAASRGTHLRSMKRLAAFGAIASIPYIALADGHWWPFNILFLLLITSTIVFLIETGKTSLSWAAYALFFVGGAFVEYWWPALGLAIVAWKYFKSPSIPALLGMFALTASLWIINHNYWALVAIPLFFASAKINVGLPRSKWFIFYAYYPLHLSIIWAVKHLVIVQ